jgi:hypothetical protein
VDPSGIVRPPPGVSAVGQKEQSLASVRRSNVGRAEQAPLDIRPDFGKVGKDVANAIIIQRGLL